MRGPRTTRHKNITRIDHPAKRTHGYNVRIGWKGKKYGKFFSDKAYGDRLGALAAAIEWRDAVERAIGKPRTEHPVVGWHSRNTTGVVGVRRRRRGGTEVYEATWIKAPGKHGRTSYSIAKHGEKKAFRLAKRARMMGEQMRLHSPRRRQQEPAPPTTQFPWFPSYS